MGTHKSVHTDAERRVFAYEVVMSCVKIEQDTHVNLVYGNSVINRAVRLMHTWWEVMEADGFRCEPSPDVVIVARGTLGIAWRMLSQEATDKLDH